MERETTGLRTRAALLLSVLGSFAGCSGDADDDRQPASWPRPAAMQIVQAVDGLLPAAAIESDRCVLRFGRRTVEVVGTTAGGEPILYCNGMRVAVDRDLLRTKRAEDVFTLLRKHAAADVGTPPGPGDLHHAHGRAHLDPLLDIAIVFPTTVLIDRGWLRRDVHTDAEERAEVVRAEYRSALDAVARLAPTLEDSVWQTLTNTLASAGRAPADDPGSPDARRRIRHGWLTDLLGDVPQARAAEAAAVAAGTPIPVETWGADRLTIERLHRPFATDCEIERNGARARIALAPPRAPAPDTSPLHDAWLVIGLRPGDDPIGRLEADALLSARLVTDGRRLAEWNNRDGFVCDRETWVREVCTGLESAALLPPHVAVTNLAGDLVALCSERGVLRPVASAAPAAIEAFLVDAARLATDLGQLHLLASYLFERSYPLGQAGDAPNRGVHHADAAGALATARGGIAIATDDDIAAVIVAVLEHQGRNAALVGSRGSLAAMWIEDLYDGVQIDLLRRGTPAQFTAVSLEKALAAAAPAIEPGWLVDPRSIHTWRIDVAADVAIRTATDPRALLSGERMRLERQLIDDVSQGLLGTAADFISDELERDSSGSDGGVLRRLAELRLATGEPRGALALAGRARAIEGSPAAQFALARLALLATIATGDAKATSERRSTLEARAETVLLAAEPLARTHTLAAIARSIERAGAADLAVSFATDALASDLEELLDATRTEPRRAERLREIVGVLAALAPRCSAPAASDPIATLLAKTYAATDTAPPDVRAAAEFATLRLRLGNPSFLALAAGRAEGDAASPLDDEEAWRHFDAHPHCWLPLIEDLIDGRLEGARADDLTNLVTRIETAGHADGELGAWIDLIRVAGGASDARDRLRRLADQNDRDRIEARIARLARAIDLAAATRVMQAWVALIGDDASWLRVAWLAAQSGDLEWAGHCANTGAGTGDEGQASLRGREATYVHEALARIGRLRTPGRPPR